MPPTLPALPEPILGRHLGRKSATAEMRRKVIPLAPFLKRMGATPPPDSVDYTAKAARTLATMLGNDQYGDCTIAAVLHQEGAQTAHQPGGAERVPTDKEAVQQYSQICGPGDQGCYIPEVLQWQRDKGMSAGGKSVKSDGFVSCQLGDQLLAKVACYLFGGLHLGINLPREWYTNANAGFVWDITNTDIVGGHSIAAVGYDSHGLKISTWGKVGTMTWAAFSDRRWVEEVYATLSPDWYNAQGLDTHGLNVSDLKKALDVVKGGGTPDIPPTPGPGPGPGPGPDPGAWDWVWDHTFNVLGYALKVHIGLDLSKATASAAKVDWFKLAADVFALVRALVKKDTNAIVAAALAILTDLGIAVSTETLKRLASAIQNEWETRPLLDKGPPANWNNVDDASGTR